MSYPYGPEPYPTFELVEREADTASAACWTEKARLDRLAERAERRSVLATDEMRFAHSLSDCQRAGLALGFALDAAGVDDPERFLQDLFAVMEDGVVGGINAQARKREDELTEKLFRDKN